MPFPPTAIKTEPNNLILSEASGDNISARRESRILKKAGMQRLISPMMANNGSRHMSSCVQRTHYSDRLVYAANNLQQVALCNWFNVPSKVQEPIAQCHVA
eukprot:Gb_22802 [translate_table: standard]